MTRKTLAGVFLVTASALAFEVNLSAQFTASTGYHFASMVVSTALLGIGGAGVFLRLFPDLTERVPFSAMSLLLAFSYPFTMAMAGEIDFDPVRLDWDASEMLSLSLYYPLFSVPFFLSALVVTGVMKRHYAKSGIIYFADMAGAAAGGIVFFLACRWAGAVPLVSLSLATAAFILFHEGRRFYVILGLSAAGACIWISHSYMELPVSGYKDISHFRAFPDMKEEAVIRGPSGRVDVISSPYLRHAPGLNPVYSKPIPAGKGVFLNGTIYSVMFPAGEDFLAELPLSLPYRFHPGGRVLVVGAGGYAEGETARIYGSMDVTVVDDMREVISALEPLTKGDGPLLKLGFARDIIALSGEYDIISLPVNSTPQGLGTGVLSENYTLTEEFVGLCLEHLSQGGILASTLPLLPPPRSEARIFRLMAEAGEDGWGGVAAFRSWGTFTVIRKKGTFSGWELERLKEIAGKLSLDAVYYPGMPESEANRVNRFDAPIYYGVVEEMKSGGDTLFNTSPPTDDSPFFGNFLKFSRLKETAGALEGRWLPLLTGGGMGILLVCQSLFFSFVFLALPALSGGRQRGGERVLPWLAYFFMIGFAYMMVEVVFIQKGILFLGGASRSMAVIIPLLLCSSAAGGAVSQRLKFGYLPSVTAGGAVFLVSFLFIGIQPHDYPPMFRTLLFAGGVAFSGFFMGMPYPLGLKSGGAERGGLVPWGMAANGFASVMGASCAPVAALVSGFSGVLSISGFIYLLSAVAAYFAVRVSGGYSGKVSGM